MKGIVVVGAGVFGAWTAHHLRAAGLRVTIVDAYGAGNSRSSSGDESRILRCGYGPDAIYSEFARRSLQLWQELAGRLEPGHAPIFHRCGVLWLAAGEDAYTRATEETLRGGRYPLKVLDGAALRARYPHLTAADVRLALLEPDCGVLMARRAVRTLAADLARGGVRVLRARATVPWSAGALRAIRLIDGTELEADAFVFACGAWLPKVFPELLGDRIRPTRQSVIYFGSPPGDDRFTAAHTPAWIDFPAGVYGVPDFEERGVKVGLDQHGPAMDPDWDSRMVDQASVDKVRAWLSRRFPALADAPVVETRVCQYENTSTGDFLIDRHPEHDNVWIVGGGSGHGFKHGPAVGEYAARLVMTGAPTDLRFSLATKEAVARRAIY